MAGIFKKYPQFVLMSLAILLSAVLIGYFVWGMQMITTNLGTAIGSGAASNRAGAGFDLEGAKRLDLKGLAQ